LLQQNPTLHEKMFNFGLDIRKDPNANKRVKWYHDESQNNGIPAIDIRH